ncbi:MAG TPA: peptidylprolyl isomerase [Albitalea sp.]|jgi:hypothetical protein|nr:peptidylprolyl isomerase [Albitalea sp.]
MSTLPTSLPTQVPPADTQRVRRSLPPWLREPLLHFVLIGAALFSIDHAIASRSDDPRVIVIDADVDREASGIFVAARGREPAAAEREALRRAWLDNEVLYREGLALGVDRGDSAIRERVIFKALSVVDANVKAPSADEKRLREWFEHNRARYDEPPRYDFQEAVLAGQVDEAAARAFAETLNKGGSGELAAGLRVFKGRPRANVIDGYGEDFARALEQAPAGEWHAYRTRDGWRAMRLDALTAPKPASFESVRGVVQLDWTDTTMAEQRTAAVRALAGKYVVRYEGSAK